MIEAQQVVSPLAAMKQALEAWQTHVYGSDIHHKAMLVAMTNMGQAIAEAEKHEVSQEPVAWMHQNKFTGKTTIIWDLGLATPNQNWKPLYTHPPQRTWAGLTDDEIIDVIHPLVMADMPDEATDYEIAKAIEAKLKQKNGFAEEKNT